MQQHIGMATSLYEKLHEPFGIINELVTQI